MTSSLDPRPIQHLYRGRGVRTIRTLEAEEAAPEPIRMPTIANLIPVTQIMSRAITCARRDLAADVVVDLMLRHRIGCLPVVEDPGRPIGMITKLDVVEQLLAGERDDADADDHARRAPARMPRTAGELMLPLAITLGERASVAHAAALMAAEGVHHLPIVDANGRLIGVVSAMDIIRWLARNDGFGG